MYSTYFSLFIQMCIVSIQIIVDFVSYMSFTDFVYNFHKISTIEPKEH